MLCIKSVWLSNGFWFKGLGGGVINAVGKIMLTKNQKCDGYDKNPIFDNIEILSA